jgi:hypothetical protein
MNIILLDDNECCLYGHQLAQQVSKSGRPLETYIVRGLDLNNYVAFVHTMFPQFSEVQDLYASYETVSDQELRKLLMAVSDRVELSMTDVKTMVRVQEKWVDYEERGNN